MDSGKSEIEGGKPPDTNGGPRVDLSGIKRGPGRPIIHGKYSEKTKKSPNSEKTSNAGEVTSDADAGFLADAIVYIFETGDELVARAAVARIAEIIPEKIGEIEELKKQVGLTVRDKELIRRCVERIAKKYSILGKFAPEILLLGVAAQWGLRQARLFRMLDKMAEEKKVAGAVNVTPQKPVPVVNGSS